MRKNSINSIFVIFVIICYLIDFILIKRGVNDSNFIIVDLAIFTMTLIAMYSISEKYKKIDLSMCIAVPIIITCFQNVLLGLIAYEISSLEMNFLIILNYWYMCILFAIMLFRKKNNFAKKIMLLFFVLVLYSLVMFVLNPTSVNGFFASFRNVTGPIMFLLVGIIIGDRININLFSKIIFTVFLIVFIFGLYERFIDGDFWIRYNIGEIWNKKGIYINIFTNKPYNHYSAEMINGQPLRRMVSTFAEPVNLGTFYLFVTLLAWWYRKYCFMFMAMLGCLLTVSKGALMGILMFFVIWCYFRLEKNSFRCISFILIIGFLGVGYKINQMGDSMAVHIKGLLVSFESLYKNPIGIGLGNAGVYGNLFALSDKSEVQESGLGVIIAQLGIIGFGIYVLVFGNILSILKERSEVSKHNKIFIYSLVFDVIFLIIFSESVLSPNSCIIFMTTIGVIVNKIYSYEDGDTKSAV